MKQTNKWLALATTSLGTVMAALNASIVNIANPVLASDFGVSMAQVQWIATIYLIITSALMLLFGRLGDRVGSHRIYIVGIAVFTLGSLACALSNSMLTLSLARALQGLGASMTIAVSMGLVSTIFPLEQRGRAIGINVLMVALGNITGPVVGGFVLTHASWHFVFLLSVPFGLAAFIMAALWLRSPLPKNPETSLNIGGSLLFTGVIASLIVFLSGGFTGQEWFGLVFAAFLVAFIAVERRAKTPLIEPALLGNKRFMLGNIIAFFSYCAYTMLIFQVPFFLEIVWSIPVGTVGLLIMVAALCMAVCGPASGFLSDSIGALKVMPLALFALLICVTLNFFLGAEEAIGLFIVIMIFAGVGMGFLNTPNNSEIMTAAGREYASFASGFVATNRNLGFCIGTALSASVFSLGATIMGWFPELFSSFKGASSLEYIFSYRTVLLVCVALVLLSLGICLYLKYGKGNASKTPDGSKQAQSEEDKEDKEGAGT